MSNSALATSVIVAIAVASVLGLSLFIVLGFCLCKQKRVAAHTFVQKNSSKNLQSISRASEMDSRRIYMEVNGMCEMDLGNDSFWGNAVVQIRSRVLDGVRMVMNRVHDSFAVRFILVPQPSLHKIHGGITPH